MTPIPIQTTVVGSYPFPGWLEYASQNLNQFGPADIDEMIEDAVIAAIHDRRSQDESERGPAPASRPSSA